jgi:hypothetical protein
MSLDEHSTRVVRGGGWPLNCCGLDHREAWLRDFPPFPPQLAVAIKRVELRRAGFIDRVAVTELVVTGPASTFRSVPFAGADLRLRDGAETRDSEVPVILAHVRNVTALGPVGAAAFEVHQSMVVTATTVRTSTFVLEAVQIALPTEVLLLEVWAEERSLVTPIGSIRHPVVIAGSLVSRGPAAGVHEQGHALAEAERVPARGETLRFFFNINLQF